MDKYLIARITIDEVTEEPTSAVIMNSYPIDDLEHLREDIEGFVFQAEVCDGLPDDYAMVLEEAMEEAVATGAAQVQPSFGVNCAHNCGGSPYIRPWQPGDTIPTPTGYATVADRTR